MIDEEFEDLCDGSAKLILDATMHMDPMVRILALTGALGACDHAFGATRQQTINAINSAFDDIEAGEIPGGTA